MNNADLDRLLHSATVPERDTEYWQDFSRAIIRRLAQGQYSGPAQLPPRRVSLLRWGIGLVTACVVVSFIMGWWMGRGSVLEQAQVAAMRKYYREIQDLFPQQVRAIILDETGPHLLLAENPDVPQSPPVLLVFQKPAGVKQVVTFSGQRIPFNGDLCEVLTDGDGNILLVGNQLIWSSQWSNERKASHSIRAQYLAQVP